MDALDWRGQTSGALTQHGIRLDRTGHWANRSEPAFCSARISL